MKTTPAQSMFSLDGKVALVTGASSGFGERFAHVLAGAGARVACVARRGDLVEKVAREIEAAGGTALGCVMDVTDLESIRRGFDLIEAELGTVDVLVNNAGLSMPAPFPDMTPEQWTSLIDVSLSGPYFVTQECARRLIAKQRSGSIIHISSILGHLAKDNFINYGTAKGGLIHMTRYMALDLVAHSIRVNAIAPGYFPTDMTNPFFESEVGKHEVAQLPPRRLGRLDELDGPLLLLASDASSYMSGSVITVDYAHSVRLS